MKASRRNGVHDHEANLHSRRFFGYGLVSVSLTFVPVATLTYVSDCYLPVNMDALLLVNGLKVFGVFLAHVNVS